MDYEPADATGLVGDIGGTNARFALVRNGVGRPELIAPHSYLCSAFGSAEEAVTAYLEEHQPGARPRSAVLAVAGPIIDGAISFTNTDWRISEGAFSSAIKLEATKLINDYAALALAVPLLSSGDAEVIGPDLPANPKATVAILGAGTGFGVSALVRNGEREAVLTTEGGHVSLAPVDELEVELWRILTLRYGRVSLERILSGPGLLELHGLLADIDGVEAVGATPRDVTQQAAAGSQSAIRTLDVFCAILGSVAGDFALAYGAQGGVFLGGGVSKHLLGALRRGRFRERFEDKGRFASYVRSIPTQVMLHPHNVAMMGAARELYRG